MNKVWKVGLIFAVLCSSFFLRSPIEIFGMEMEETAEFDLTADTSHQKRQLEMYDQLVDGLKAEVGISVSNIHKLYQSGLQPEVLKRNPQIDTYIVELLQAVEDNEHQAAKLYQGMDKALLWYFYDEIGYFIKEASGFLQSGEPQSAQIALEQAIELYLGSLGQMTKNNDQIYSTTVSSTINTVLFPSLLQAVDQDNAVSFNMYGQMLENTLLKTFILHLVDYAKRVEISMLEDKLDQANAYQTGAFFLFMPIYHSFPHDTDQELNCIKTKLLESNPAAVESDKIKADLIKSINRKLNKTLNLVFHPGGTEEERAVILEYTAQAISVADDLEIFFSELTEGKALYNQLQQNSEALLGAIHQGEWETGKKHAYALLALASTLQGVSLRIGEKTIKVNGGEIVYASPATFIDHNTHRTLAAARLITEALGAKVSYDKNTKMVRITQGDKTITMALNSKRVQVNDQSSHVSLEQSVIIKDGRAYIPLRAVAELLGYSVFWYERNVVMN